MKFAISPRVTDILQKVDPWWPLQLPEWGGGSVYVCMYVCMYIRINTAPPLQIVQACVSALVCMYVCRFTKSKFSAMVAAPTSRMGH